MRIETIFTETEAAAAVPVSALLPSELGAFLEAQDGRVRRQWSALGLQGRAGDLALLTDASGALAQVVYLGDPTQEPLMAGALAPRLPAGTYRFETLPDGLDRSRVLLAWGLGGYGFDAYKAEPRKERARIVASAAEIARLAPMLEGAWLARDLVNRPANDMGPDEVEAAARAIADRFGGEIDVIKGDALAEGFPLIEAVGRASPREPRLIDLRLGRASGRKVTVVGKGVVFDTGGLNIKPDNSMLLMKKDMGGAANALGLAHMVAASGLDLSLRVLLPTVENAIAGNAFRPGDVFRSRAGITVEIGNTDAEGRLVLADAITYACEETPELLVDLATLTGAARVALGPDLPAFFANDEVLAAEIADAAAQAADPLWRLPLWQGYKAGLASSVADTNNIAPGGFAGAIIAALFLERFVARGTRWAHFDIFAWSPKAQPGKTEGGEAHAIRALFTLLCKMIGAEDKLP